MVAEAVFMFVLYMFAAFLQLVSNKLVFGLLMFLVPLFSYYSGWWGTELSVIMLVFAVILLMAKLRGAEL